MSEKQYQNKNKQTRILMRQLMIDGILTLDDIKKRTKDNKENTIKKNNGIEIQ